MANDRQTTNYLDLILPKGPEYYSVQDGNTNFTILDTKIEEIVNSITSLNININSTIEKVVADLIGGATEGIDSLKDILDLLNDPESGELVKINEAINQRVTIESFDQFKTEHTRVHDTVNGRLTAIDDPVTGSVAIEQTARIAADEALDEKIGSLELLKTTNKEDIINAINEIVGNIGALTSLKTSVKTSIVNAINSNKESIDALTTDTSDYKNKNGFYFYNLKNVLISDKSDDCYSYSNVSGNTYAFDITLKDIKLFYYGKIIDINRTYRMQTPTTGTYVIYVGMQMDETDYMSDNDTGYAILETSGEDLVISPSDWIIGCERTTTNNENKPIILPDDELMFNGVVFKQPLIRISVTNSTSGSTINSISWVNDNNLPTLDYTNYYDYVNGIYRLVEENLGDAINSKIDNINSEINDIKLDIGNIYNDSYIEITNNSKFTSTSSRTDCPFIGTIDLTIKKTYVASDGSTTNQSIDINDSVNYTASGYWDDECTLIARINTETQKIDSYYVLMTSPGEGYKSLTKFNDLNKLFNKSDGYVDIAITIVTYLNSSYVNFYQPAGGDNRFSGSSTMTMIADNTEKINELNEIVGKSNSYGGFIGGSSATATAGGAVGYNASATEGGAVGNGAEETGGGFAGGYSASADYGGAVGYNASAASGGAVGNNASATVGGAVGYRASATSGGFAGGNGASATVGGAVGNQASATHGGAVGNNASAAEGGAIGQASSAISGGAVGYRAKTSTGFAGGSDAKTIDDENNGIDAIQLGTGTNSTEKTLQVYEYQLMDADGNIPSERLKTSDGGFAAAGGSLLEPSRDNQHGVAIGKDSTATGGAAIGPYTYATFGGAVGYEASTISGGAVGYNAESISGFAGGSSASATSGGAVGIYAKTSTGFAGGYEAKTQDSSGDGIDAIQLGTGTNQTTKTLQVYTYQLMDASGNVPSARLTQAVNSMGSDFAESLEWLDGNPNNEDRRGLFVTLTSDENNEYNKIKLANSDDEIVGVVSSIPTVVGNSCNDNWKGKYQTDIFGKPLTQIVHHEAVYEDVEVRDKDEDGNLLKTTHTESVLVSEAYDTEEYILSSEYDPSQEYIPRLKRKEWASIGFIGQLIVVDDGTCIPGKKCKCGNNGVGTLSDNDTGYRVLSRIDNTHIKILLK